MQILENVKRTVKTFSSAPAENPELDMDILDKLKQEHEAVDGLLKQLIKSESAPTRKSLLGKIQKALIPHLHAEQKVVYDAIIAQKDRKAKTDGAEGYLEHETAEKTLLKLIKISNTLSPEFDATAKVLKELVEHHVEEEEKNVWRDVKEYFDEDDRIEMNRKFEAAKKRVHA